MLQKKYNITLILNSLIYIPKIKKNKSKQISKILIKIKNQSKI